MDEKSAFMELAEPLIVAARDGDREAAMAAIGYLLTYIDSLIKRVDRLRGERDRLKGDLRDLVDRPPTYEDSYYKQVCNYCSEWPCAPGCAFATAAAHLGAIDT